MKKVLLSTLVVVLALSLALPMPVAAAPDPVYATLYAGNGGPEVGWVKVWEDETNLYVAYMIDLSTDWVLTETNVAVGTCVDGACEGIPVNKKGNPKVGKFPYSDPHGPVTFKEYVIPLSSVTGPTLCIAAHAVVDNPWYQEETAWARTCAGYEFPGRSWATYFCYTLQQ